MWRSEVSSLSYRVGHGGYTQVVELGSEHLNPLSHLASPLFEGRIQVDKFSRITHSELSVEVTITVFEPGGHTRVCMNLGTAAENKIMWVLNHSPVLGLQVLPPR